MGVGAADCIATSTDGVTFTGQGNGTFDAGTAVAFSSAEGRWVAAGNGANHLATSVDAFSWTGAGAVFGNSSVGVRPTVKE